MKRAAKYFPAAPIAIVTVVLAWRTLRALFAEVGEPCATLDDSYIHFQYARAIAQLHPFHYQAGMPPTSGATSVMWPLLLAPFWLIGFRGQAIMWPAWALGFGALGMLAWESYHLAKPLAGRWGAVGSAAMVLSFSAFTWCAASGMEVVPFAWAMARSARRASEWREDPVAGSAAGGTAQTSTTRTHKRLYELVALAFVTALMRPEGALISIAIALVLGVFPLRATIPSRAWSLAALAGAFSVPAILRVFTGSAKSNTALAKLLVGNPYYTGAALVSTVEDNFKTLGKTLLQGKIWSTEFLPTNALPVGIMALIAIVVAGFTKRKLVRAAFVLGIAIGICIPCFYVTFLWNRLRYLWPFATGWLIGLACLASVLGDVATLIHPRARAGIPMLLGFFAGAFIVRLDWVIDDVANSARGIDKQHVTIGRWAHDHLPQDALVAVNDTGAIAYFSDRRTFDIVGLTTRGEAKYWVGGTASRIEHYERMGKGALPTHFIVYPEWMGTDAFFGKELFSATVTDSTILGGQSMRAYEADWSLLGSGEKPWSETKGEIVDTLDVADLESEEAHRYELLARDNEEVVGDSESPEGARVIDGGRGYRFADRFVAHLRPGRATRVIARLGPTRGKTVIEARAAGQVVASFTIGEEESSWSEQTFEIPASDTKEETPLELAAREGTFSSYHYWFIPE